jgi:hypothetical protein
VQCGARLVSEDDGGPVTSEAVAASQDRTGEQAPNQDISTPEIETDANTSLPTGSAAVLVERGPNAGTRFVLDRDLITVGRHPDSDIRLDDVTVSRRHAEFHRDIDGFWVHDVGSLNGTYVNREPTHTAVLASGDRVQIGKFRLLYLTAPAAAAR